MTGRRCLFPGCKPTIVAYDEDGKMLVALPCRPKRVGQWLAEGISSADRKRLARALVRQSETSYPLFAEDEGRSQTIEVCDEA